MAIVISGVNNNDKITASDGTIDLLSGVNYVGVITAPSITASNNITAGNLNIGSNIQLGNAGVATATTFVGNLTGNVNATSNLLLQIGGSEKFRVASSGQLGIGGANYGTSGQVLTSGGSGSAATWSTISGTTINNNATTKFITGTNNANELDCEANLSYNNSLVTFSSSSLMVDKGTNPTISAKETAGNKEVQLRANTDGGLLRTVGNYPLIFGVNQSEKVRILNSGKLCMGGSTGQYTLNNTSTDIIIGSGGSGRGITFHTSAYADNMTISFHANESLSRAEGEIKYGPPLTSTTNDRNAMMFRTNSAERLRITSNGRVGINSTSPQQALDVRGSINGGSENQPFLRFHDSHGDQRVTKHYFRCTKGGTTIYDITTVDLNTNFHQALIIIYYGARIQAVADSNTYPVHKIIGVNRFNGGSIQFDKQVIQQNSNAQNHADIDAVATSSTNYRVRLTFSGTAGGSSFAAGYVEIIGLGPGTDGAFYSLAHGSGITR